MVDSVRASEMTDGREFFDLYVLGSFLPDFLEQGVSERFWEDVFMARSDGRPGRLEVGQDAALVDGCLVAILPAHAAFGPDKDMFVRECRFDDRFDDSGSIGLDLDRIAELDPYAGVLVCSAPPNPAAAFAVSAGLARLANTLGEFLAVMRERPDAMYTKESGWFTPYR